MRLPELAARPQRAERPSLETVRPTDLGLGAVAQNVAEWQGEVDRTRDMEEEAQRLDDEAAAEPILNELRERFEGRFAEAGALWDGIEPGFARMAMITLDSEAEPYLNRPLSPGQRDAVARGVAQYKEATGQRAIQYQAQRRGQMAAQQQQAREATAMGGVMAEYAETFAARRAVIDQAYDGSADYVGQVLAAHDEVVAARLETAPEAMRPRIVQQMAGRRLQLQAEAMDVEARTEQAAVAGTARDAGNRLVNAVLTAPSLYETSAADVDQVVAGLPAAQRGAARAGLMNDLTEGYVTALIRDGQQDLALERLNSGSLDNRLNPDSKARLLDQARRKAEELTVDDWMTRLRVAGSIDDDIASRATTGVGTGLDAGTVAAALGPREAAEYQLRVEAAEKAHQSLTGYAQMTEPQIRAQVEALAPQPGQADFADAQRRYQTAQQAAAAELKAREDDPAAWALRNSPGLMADLQAVSGGDVNAARRAAGAYGAGTLAQQRAAGIPLAEQRLLSKPMAAQMVEAANGDADPARGLRDLGSVIQSFAPPAGADGATVTGALARQRMVISELQQAGADPGDLAAAVDLANDPVRLGKYVAADRNNALAALERRDRDALTGHVETAMRPWLRSLEALPGSRTLNHGRMVMAQRLAAEQVRARGGSPREAAAEAAEVVAGQYVFVGPSGWRMPRTIANRREPGGGATFHQTLAQRGASRTLSTLTANNGAGFYAPADNGRGLTEAQRRERYADSVASRGKWVTTPDDGALALMHPTLDGSWTAALDRSGRPITRSWAMLVDAGRDRRTRNGTTGGGVPRGIRNNNPGNIESRANNRWQGQSGDDGRFARFETPLHGLRALARDLTTKHARGLDTVQEIISVWAPPSENNTGAYVAAVSRALGVQPRDRLDVNDPRVLATLMGSIIQHENGQQPYDNELIVQAARLGARR